MAFDVSRRCLCSLLFLLLSPLSPAAQSTDGMPPGVAQVARSARVAQDTISLWVQRIGDPAPLNAFNAQTPRNPASTMKLATTFAALNGLGPTHTWATDVFIPGGIQAGGVVGDLWLKGGGDPFLVVEEVWKIAGELRDKGVRRITGDLVIDDSYFQLPPEDPAAFDNQPDRAYNLVPNALLVNFNTVRFTVQAQADGRIGVRADPPLPNLRVINRLKAAAGPCRGYQYGVAVSITGDARRDAQFDGSFPSRCRRFDISRTVLQADTYAWGLFTHYWQELGGEITGAVRRGTLPAGNRRPFLRHYSRPLGDIIRLVNKYSNNVMTRHLELTLGAERYEAPATPEKGHQAILDVLHEHGVNTEGMVIANSAGLSRDSRVSAEQLAQILLAGWRSSYMPEYVSSLALAGMDGTMRSRLNGTSGAGRMHVKTGRLDDVSAVAGYVTAKSGERLIAVLLINAPGAHLGPGNLLQNAFLRWVHDNH